MRGSTLAEIPFLKKGLGGRRASVLRSSLSGGQSDLAKEASQLIQYKILLTYLPRRKREHG